MYAKEIYTQNTKSKDVQNVKITRIENSITQVKKYFYFSKFQHTVTHRTYISFFFKCQSYFPFNKDLAGKNTWKINRKILCIFHFEKRLEILNKN